METTTTQTTATLTSASSENVNILDLLRVIGMQEVTSNIFTLPTKKRRK